MKRKPGMTADTIASLVLGSGGLLSGAAILYSVVEKIRDRKRTVAKQQADLSKQGADTQLTTEQIQLVKQEASQAVSTERRESEKWWSDQIERLREDLHAEQTARRELTEWANLHQIWDRRAWILALEADPDYPPPPVFGHT